MRGSIETKEKCPQCKGKFQHLKKIGYICPRCKTTPRRFFIYFSWQGKRYRIYSTPTGTPLDSYSIALSVLSRINEEIKNHAFDPSKYVKAELRKFYTSNLLNEYYHHKIPTIAPSYRSTFKKHIETAKQFFGAKDIREIRKIDLERYMKSLEQQQKSPKTVKNYLDTFRAFLSYCRDLELISTIPNPPVIEKPKPKIHWVDTEAQLAIYHATPHEHKPLILFLMLTGCRPGEARALKARDINLSQGTITISRTFSKNTIVQKRKGKNSLDVVIPIHPELYPTLELVVKNKLPDAFVFTNPRTNQPYSQESLQRLWNSIRKKLNLPPDLRLYDVTRHSLASNLLNQGATLSDISALLGHTSITTTQRYAHMDIARTKIVLNKISLFKKENNSKIAEEGKR